MGKKNNSEEEPLKLTPWGCLYTTLCDYGINTNGITGAIGEHLVNDFMECMMRHGHVTKEE